MFCRLEAKDQHGRICVSVFFHLCPHRPKHKFVLAYMYIILNIHLRNAFYLTNSQTSRTPPDSVQHPRFGPSRRPVERGQRPPGEPVPGLADDQR